MIFDRSHSTLVASGPQLEIEGFLDVNELSAGEYYSFTILDVTLDEVPVEN